MFLLGALLLAGPGCPHPAPPDTAPHTPSAGLGPPDAFGVRARPDNVLVPRASLVHRQGPDTFLLVDGALWLHRDRTGLLGAMGLRRGDTLLTCAGEEVADVLAADACFARFFTDDAVRLQVQRNATPRTLYLVFDGPPIPAPRRALAALDTEPVPIVERPPDRESLAVAYGLVRAGTSARMPRGALVRLLDDGVHVRPLRAEGAIVAYEVESPVLAALGWTGATSRVDELALTSDEAVADALARLFSADRVLVTPTDGGAPLTITLEGSPTAPPALWKPRVVVDARERRSRDGVRIDGAHRYVPRAALTSLDAIARDESPRRGGPPEDVPGPVTVYRALGGTVADLLDLPWDAPLERMDGVAVYGATSLTALRRRLLTGAEVSIELGGATPKRVLVHVEGEPVVLPDDWPARRRGAPELAPDPLDEHFVRDGDTVRTSRLALRSVFSDPLSGHPHQDGVRLAPNVLWGALDVPIPAVLTAVDGTPATDPTALEDLGTRLCTAPRVTLTLVVRGEVFQRVVVIDGPPATPP
ncbi:MAG: hypothetical protein V4850_24265 [Myxococcota bacterium]